MEHLYPQRALLRGEEARLFNLVSSSATPLQWEKWLRAPLEHAAVQGDLDLVTRLLKAGASGKAGWRGCNDRSLLDAAALGGNAGVVSALLRAGAGPDVNVITASSGRSALYLAVDGGHEGAARQLLVAGADVNFVDPVDECGPLYAAIRGGNTGLVSDLLIGGANPEATLRGKTALHEAAAEGHEEIVSLLLNSSADKDPFDYRGYTPLMGACAEGHVSTVEILLAAGANQSLRSPGMDLSALDVAARFGRTDILKAILANGADVDDANDDGNTALHQAAEYYEEAAIGVLLDAGIDVDVKTNEGVTPLTLAVTSPSAGIALVLLRRGAKVDETDVNGSTPLHAVCGFHAYNMSEVVDLLLRWGASETAVKDDGKTPADMLHNHGLRCEISADEGSDDECCCYTHEVERVRVLLARAPMDRSWRRRCWLVMLRWDAAEREDGTQCDGYESGGTEEGGEFVPGDEESGGVKCIKVNDEDAERASSGGDGSGSDEESFGGLVTVLLGLDSQSVFRKIVGYL